MTPVTAVTPVTTVTARAEAADNLTPADYRDIYDELRSKAPLRGFVEMIHSQYSIAWWSKYERNDVTLTRPARNELRVAVGLPALPLTVAEATVRVNPDATVYQVGRAPATRVVLVGADAPAALTLRLNGNLAVEHPERSGTASQDPAQTSGVTAVTRPPRRATPTRAIRVSLTRFERLNAARRRAGLTWDAFLDRLTASLEEPS